MTTGRAVRQGLTLIALAALAGVPGAAESQEGPIFGEWSIGGRAALRATYDGPAVLNTGEWGPRGMPDGRTFSTGLLPDSGTLTFSVIPPAERASTYNVFLQRADGFEVNITDAPVSVADLQGGRLRVADRQTNASLFTGPIEGTPPRSDVPSFLDGSPPEDTGENIPELPETVVPGRRSGGGGGGRDPHAIPLGPGELSGGGGGRGKHIVPCGGPGEKPCTIDDLKKLFINIFNALMGLAALAAVGAIVVGGTQYILARGDPGAMGAAKQKLTFAVIGLLVILFSVVLVNTILRLLGYETPLEGIQ